MSIYAYKTPWLVEGQVKIQPRLRLFCFPYAGGGASIFRHWQQAMPADIQIFAIQLPGRENRITEPPLNRLHKVVNILSRIMVPYYDAPFAFYGHSLGAKIAFELTRTLRREKGLLPTHLLVSGARAPNIPEPSPLHHLSDADFIEGLRRYSAMPEEVLQNNDLMQIFLPVLRADFCLDETYEYREDAPMACPVTAFGGREDSEANQEELQAWRQHTTAQFACHMFPGDHFFIKESRQAVLNAIVKTLAINNAQ